MAMGVLSIFMRCTDLSRPSVEEALVLLGAFSKCMGKKMPPVR
jgi:hypothetical protein